jgi:hypothetical protein
MAFPERIHLEVTDNDLKAGTRADGQTCALALAALRELGGAIRTEVNVFGLFLGEKRGYGMAGILACYVPMAVQQDDYREFIELFDAGVAPAQRSFDFERFE